MTLTSKSNVIERGQYYTDQALKAVKNRNIKANKNWWPEKSNHTMDYKAVQVHDWWKEN